MDHTGYFPPFKDEVDFFEYDLGIWSRIILNLTRDCFPTYLDKFQQRLHYFADNVPQNKPKQFGDYDRIYLVDNRLKPLFLCKDESRDISKQCYEIAKHRFNLEDDIFGEYPHFQQSLLGGPYNAEDHQKFINTYGFSPVDETNLNWLLIFEEDELIDTRMVSPWVITLLLLKYKDRNLIDWDQIIEHPFNIY